MDTAEESGLPVGGRDTTDAVTLVPPPLSPQQVQDVVDAIKACQKAIDSLGALGGAFAKWALNRILDGLRAIPIAPITPPLGTQEPSTPPPTTP